MCFKSAIALLLAGCCFGATATEVRVGFRDSVYRGANMMPAGELINVWSENTVLAASIETVPLALQAPRTTIAGDAILAYLKKRFPKTQFRWIGLREIDWRPPLRIIAGEEIIAAAVARMERHLQNEFQRVVVRPVGHHPELSIAADVTVGDIAIVARVNNAMNLRSRMAIPVDIIGGGKILDSTSVWIAVEAYRNVPVFIHELQRGDVPESEDVRLQAVDFARLNENPLSIDALTGELRLKYPVRAGAVLTRGLLEPAPEVSKGERVKVKLTSDAIAITAWGIATTEGFTGDIVKVLIDNAEAPAFARVTGQGETKIEL